MSRLVIVQVAVFYGHHVWELLPAEQSSIEISDTHKKLGISREVYIGGEVLIAPFNLGTIAEAPKTVYAMNTIFLVTRSLADMDAILDCYLTPISSRA